MCKQLSTCNSNDVHQSSHVFWVDIAEVGALAQ